MFNDSPALTHAQQQQAVEEIQELMATGMSSGEAIVKVAAALREKHKNDNVTKIGTVEEE